MSEPARVDDAHREVKGALLRDGESNGDAALGGPKILVRSDEPMQLADEGLANRWTRLLSR